MLRIAKAQKRAIEQALIRNNGKRMATARELNIDKGTLRRIWGLVGDWLIREIVFITSVAEKPCNRSPSNYPYYYLYKKLLPFLRHRAPTPRPLQTTLSNFCKSLSTLRIISRLTP
jgi:hypothetical protein